MSNPVHMTGQGSGGARVVRALLAVAVLIPVLVMPAGASAAHGESCRIEYTKNDVQSRSCGINFYGPPLFLYADTCSADCRTGTVTVHATISINNGTIVLAECEATGVGFASCSDDVGVGEAVSTVVGAFPLACRVGTSSKSGELRCASGCQGPTSGVQCALLATPLPTP